jgi:ribosomal protein S6
MDNKEKDKKEYELALLLRSEADLAPILMLVGQHNGEPMGEPRAKNLVLAYEVKGRKEAVFAVCNFKAMSDEAKGIETDLNSRQEVLRHMIIASPAPAERAMSTLPPRERKGRPMRTTPMEARPAAAKPLSNEALEKKIEEISQ